MNELIQHLFDARDVAHKLHLSTKSFAQHLALGDLYEKIVEIADEVAEVYQGKYGLIDFADQPSTIESSTDPLTFVSQLAEWAEETKTSFDAADTHLLNIWDELISTVYRAKYKLENLH